MKAVILGKKSVSDVKYEENQNRRILKVDIL